MKLIEAIKNLKTIEKRMEKNCAQILQYSAWVSTEQPAFETEEKQRAQVGSLIQSNLDMEKEYLKLKTSVERTNLATIVTIGTHSYSISELITLKDRVHKDGRNKTPGLASFRTRTYLSLNAQPAAQRMQQIYAKGIDATSPAKVVLAYREEDKNNALREWEEFTSAIDGRLEVVNAETELMVAA